MRMRKFKRQHIEEEMREAALQIRQRYPSPIVACIGAQYPDASYHMEMGMRAGHDLARFMDHHHAGTLMTGGMGGVGADIFTGVTKYRLQPHPHGHSFNAFFILIPKWERYLVRGLEEHRLPFEEPEIYPKMAMLLNTTCTKESAGDSLDDRRLALVHTADLALCFNGTGGTLDEASMMIKMGKPVITCTETGGVSRGLQRYKAAIQGHERMDKGMEDVFNVLPLTFDLNLIVETSTVNEAIQAVIRYIQKEVKQQSMPPAMGPEEIH